MKETILFIFETHMFFIEIKLVRSQLRWLPSFVFAKTQGIPAYQVNQTMMALWWGWNPNFLIKTVIFFVC